MITFINDIRQDYRHADFVSVSNSGLGYATSPYIGANFGDPKPEDMCLKEWLRAWDRYEERIQAMKMRGEYERDY